MKPHVKTYLKYFDIGIEDIWMCENCGRSFPINNGLEIHHIQLRSKGGRDNIENLMCLCRYCHDKVHTKGLHVSLNTSRINRKP